MPRYGQDGFIERGIFSVALTILIYSRVPDPMKIDFPKFIAKPRSIPSDVRISISLFTCSLPCASSSRSSTNISPGMGVFTPFDMHGT